MQKTMDIKGLQNMEKYVNQFLSQMNGRRSLEDIELKDSFVFNFSDEENKNAKTFVKQFSKKKYESIEEAIFQFRKLSPKYSAENREWSIVCIIEFEKNWLVFFDKNT